jgi:hypothetical protein
MSRTYPDLHDHIEALRKAGLLIVVDRPINKDTEMHPLVRWQFRGGIREEDRKAFLFTNVTDGTGRAFDIPVLVCGLAGNRAIYSLGMQCAVDEIRDTWIRAMTRPIPPQLVADAPCQEIVYTGADLTTGHGLDDIPVPISTPGWDNAAYTTSSHYITKDPETGTQNMGYRGQLKAPDRLGMNTSIELRTGGYVHWLKWKALGKPMPCAVVLGCPPAVSFTAVQKLPEHVDEAARDRWPDRPAAQRGQGQDGRPARARRGGDRHRGLRQHGVPRARSPVRRVPRPRQPPGVQRLSRRDRDHAPARRRDHLMVVRGAPSSERRPHEHRDANAGQTVARARREPRMTLGIAHLSPVLSIIFGVLILIMPRFLNYFVAIYLILAGLLGLGVLR